MLSLRENLESLKHKLRKLVEKELKFTKRNRKLLKPKLEKHQDLKRKLLLKKRSLQSLKNTSKQKKLKQPEKSKS